MHLTEIRQKLDKPSRPVSDSWLRYFGQEDEADGSSQDCEKNVLEWFQKYDTLLIGVLKSSKVVVSRAKKNQNASYKYNNILAELIIV
jgi:hypothetical protein